MIAIERRFPFVRDAFFIINIEKENIPFEKGYICFKKNKYFFSTNEFDKEFLNLDFDKVNLLDVMGNKKYKVSSISYLMGIDNDKEFDISILKENTEYSCYYGKRNPKSISTNIMKIIGFLFVLFMIYYTYMGYEPIFLFIIGIIFVLILFFSTPYINNLYLREIIRKINQI